MVAHDPLHTSERAGLPHWAPASGNHAHAAQGIRITYACGRKPLIDQPDAGALANGEYELTGGFWFPQAPGDCNVDGGISLHDFDELVDCATGPDGGLPAECMCFDLDRDGDVDLHGFAEFQTGFSG